MVFARRNSLMIFEKLFGLDLLNRAAVLGLD